MEYKPSIIPVFLELDALSSERFWLFIQGKREHKKVITTEKEFVINQPAIPTCGLYFCYIILTDKKACAYGRGFFAILFIILMLDLYSYLIH